MSIEKSIEILNPLDMSLQLLHLKELKPGWLEGDGEVPDPSDLDWLGILWEDYFQALTDPYLYPMADGNVIIEWKIPDIALNLEVDLPNKQAILFHFDKKTDFDETFEYDLRDENRIRQLVAEVKKYAGEKDE